MRTGTEDKIDLLLLRHGATLSNAEDRYLGRTDEPLSEAGRQELLQKRDAYKEPKPDLVFTGPMARCRESAELLFALRPALIPEWTEIDFGAFEGKDHHDLDGDPDYQAWIDSGGALPFPGGESLEAFICRSMEGFDRMWSMVSARLKAEPLRENDRQKGSDGRAHVAAVVHGGTIMSIMSTLTGDEYYDFQSKNGEGYLLSLTSDEGGRAVLSDYRRISDP